MLPSRSAVLQTLVVASLGLSGTALLAQRGGWGGPGWDGPGWREPAWGGRIDRRVPSREGKVDVARFRAEGDAALALGHGAVTVVPMAPEPDAESGMPDATGPSPTFEAAVEDRLVKAGYDTVRPVPGTGQIAEVRIMRAQAEPAEAPHKPVSGEMTMGVSNHGSMMGVALAYDGSKPRGALISTRLEARIRDRATGAVLWEGRADIITREGDQRWTEQAVATKLAGVLFDGFPARTGER